MSAAPPERIVGLTLAGSGVNIVASCSIEAYDARAPAAALSRALMPEARGVVVVASGGRELWERVRAAGAPGPDPVDDYVSARLDEAGAALARAGVAFRRFEARLDAEPFLDFRALGEIVGLGSMGPFGMLIHAEHGPWWALRGAFMVDRAVALPRVHVPPCRGCPAPCVGAQAAQGPEKILLATPEARKRCVFGQTSRYDDDQIAHHYPTRGIKRD